MKIFLTGGSGFVGRHLATELASRGHGLACLVRAGDSSGAAFLRGLGASVTSGSVTDPASLEGAAEGADAVIHLVGIILERPGASFSQVHVEGTVNVLAEAKRAGAGRFIHMSAAGAAAVAVSRYLETKWTAEEEVRASGLSSTIFRPSIIYGPRGEFIHMLIRQVRLLPVVPVIGDGRYRLQPVSIFDIARIFADSLTNPKTINKTYAAGGPRSLSYNEMVDAIAAVIGKHRLKLHLPVSVMKPAAAVAEKIMPRPFVTRDQINMLLEGSTVDIEAMKADFGIEPVEFKDGIRQLIESG